MAHLLRSVDQGSVQPSYRPPLYGLWESYGGAESHVWYTFSLSLKRIVSVYYMKRISHLSTSARVTPCIL
jgi:hypothetical protein